MQTGVPETVTNVQHLAPASSHVGRSEIGDFVQLKILFWIEVMNLLDSRLRARGCILKVRSYVV